MNELAMEHFPESKYCFAENKGTVTLRLRISKFDCPETVEVIYGGKYDYASKRLTASMMRFCEDRLYAYYTVTVALSDVRFVYVFRIIENGREFFFSEDGLTETYDFTLNYYNCFQLAYINEVDIMKSVNWMKTAVFYQIFVDRFNIGDNNKDTSYVNMKWGELPKPKSFAGGDLKGIIEKLPYLRDLGVNALYLTPIFKSVSNHKYDISDYYEIDEQFGSKDDLRLLVDTAHSMGMHIVLDAVFNHCSEKFSPFQDVVKNGQKSKYYDWFIVAKDKPLEYECFASCKYMPKFNTSNPEVCEYLIGVATYWIREFDIDGWRLDVSDEISHDFWRVFRKAVKSVKSDCVLIGENWHDANVYLQGDQYDSIMNYAFTKACLDFYAFNHFTARQFADKLNGLLMRNNNAANGMMLNLLDSHDTHRFVTWSGSEEKLLSALALMFFYVGTPCIYYGTEIALQGNHDPDSRRTFDWNKAKDTKTVIMELLHTVSRLKREGRLFSDKISITENDGIIKVERDKLTLILNCNEYQVSYVTKAEIFSNKYKNGKIDSFGFVIAKREA